MRGEGLKGFTVVSYNVNYALCQQDIGISEKRVLQAILEADADVVLLQETHHLFETLLDSVFAITENFPFRCFVNDGVDSAGGSSVLSKFEIRHATEVRCPVEGSWFRQWFGLFDLGHSSVWIANVHLRPPLDDNGRAGVSTMSRTSEVRLAELQHLVGLIQTARSEHTATDSPIIIAGDFNESCRYDTLSFARDSLQFEDALCLTSAHTHWWPVKKLSATKYVALRSRLDHCLFEPARLRCEDCRILSQYEGCSSDHLPVVVTFNLLDANHNEPEQEKFKLPAYTGFKLGVTAVVEGSVWRTSYGK